MDGDIAVVDEENSAVVCLIVVDDGEDGVDSVVYEVAPIVESLSLVEESTVVVVIEDAAVVNVDGAVVVDSISGLEVY